MDPPFVRPVEANIVPKKSQNIVYGKYYKMTFSMLQKHFMKKAGILDANKVQITKVGKNLYLQLKIDV